MTRGIAQHSKAAFQREQGRGDRAGGDRDARARLETMAKYPFPLSVAMGALAAAASLAQINAIRSATFEAAAAASHRASPAPAAS